MTEAFMQKKLAILFSALCAFAGAAQSQTIISNGTGKTCYQTALKQQNPHNGHIAKCTKAIESNTLNPRDLAASYVNRGILYMRASKFDDALTDYDRAIRLRPRLGDAYLNKGAAKIASGQPGEAIDLLTYALELNTGNPEAAHYNLGLAYELTGDVTSAYESLQKALEIHPGWSLPLTQLERYSIVSEG